MVRQEKIHLIVQARMTSSRLPGKVLLPILGKPVIVHIWEILKRVSIANRVIIATTNSPADDALVKCAENVGIDIFRGDENDVLARYYHCAMWSGADLVVRVTADDPMKDPSLIERAIDIMLETPSLDYVSNTICPTFPAGQEVEVFRFEALKKAYKEAKLLSEREHVTPYIWKNPDIFKIKNFEHTENISDWRWTLDKKEDLQLINLLYRRFYKDGKLASYIEIIEYLKKHPELIIINIETDRNEGYIKSVAHDSFSDS